MSEWPRNVASRQRKEVKPSHMTGIARRSTYLQSYIELTYYDCLALQTTGAKSLGVLLV